MNKAAKITDSMPSQDDACNSLHCLEATRALKVKLQTLPSPKSSHRNFTMKQRVKKIGITIEAIKDNQNQTKVVQS